MNTDLINFFYPKSVCIVGASSKEKSIGYEILKSIKNYTFTGGVFPVNPKIEKILGYQCYKSILGINENIDLAIIVVPKKFVDESINQLISKKVKSVILITAGFKETGEEGEKQENNLIAKIKENNMRLVGPNCMGVISALDEIRLNATFVAEQPVLGGIGFLSQSGALGAAVLNSLRESDIRFAHFISIGNKADVSEIDVLEFWLSDKNVKTITFYLESFEHGLELIKKYRTNTQRKPLIILKSGKTKSGMKAASSHTGALSSNEKIIGSLLKQFGIIRVNTLNELFNTAKGFEHFPIPDDNKVVVVTNAGGPGILAVDKIEERNLLLAELTEETRIRLKEIVHPEGSINNPIDLLPGATPETFKIVNEIILEDENVDSIISIFVEPVMVNSFEVIESVNAIVSDKPIYQVCMPLPEFWNKYLTESKYKKPIFKNPEDPAEIISNILIYEEKKNQSLHLNDMDLLNFSDLSSGYFLDQEKVTQLCESYDIPITSNKTIVYENVDDYSDFNFPIVVKGLSEQVVHKSELDAVKLNIQTKAEFKSAVDEIHKSFSGNNIKLEKLLIQPYINTKHELLIGGFRDPSFGPVVMFGSGGKYVEVLDDTKLKSAFLSEKDLDEIINETKIGKIIKGVRGEDGVNINRLKEIIKSVAKMMTKNNNILEIDLNPLVVDFNRKFHAVDIRIKTNSEC